MRVTFYKGDLFMMAETEADRKVLQKIYDHTDVAGCGFLLGPYRIDHVSLDIKGKDVGLKELHEDAVVQAVTDLVTFCHTASTSAGWWTDLKTGESLIHAPRVIPEKLCLIHSEVSEALEGYRKDLMDDKLPHRKMVEVELADACIRIFDLAGAMGLDLGGALAEKMEFNRTRLDHTLEHRKSANGKSF